MFSKEECQESAPFFQNDSNQLSKINSFVLYNKLIFAIVRLYSSILFYFMVIESVVVKLKIVAFYT
jgi:hypothetical protein